ncbi:MAG: hypothetical protein RIB59_04855 [Rhodospirillales bacterium]
MMINPVKSLKILSGAAFIASAVIVPSPVQAVDFKGKKIEIIVPSKEGSGSDTYVRLFAPYMEKFLPGNPAILVRNVPGGALVKGSNRFEQRAKPDGLTLLSMSTSTFVSFLFGGKKIEYDPRGWRAVMVSPLGTAVYAHPKTGAKGKDIVADLKALKKSELIFGAKAALAGESRILIMYEMLGLNVKSIFGVEKGVSRKAMMRGEFTLGYDSMSGYIKHAKPMIERGEAVPLFSMGYAEGDKIVRDPLLKDLPHFAEAYEKLTGKKPEGPAWDTLKNFIFMAVSASKSIVLPKGTPQEIVDIYVKVFKDMNNDPAFAKLAKKQLGGYPQIYGADGDAVIRNAVNFKPEARAWFKAFMKRKYDVNI